MFVLIVAILASAREAIGVEQGVEFFTMQILFAGGYLVWVMVRVQPVSEGGSVKEKVLPSSSASR